MLDHDLRDEQAIATWRFHWELTGENVCVCGCLLLCSPLSAVDVDVDLGNFEWIEWVGFCSVSGCCLGIRIQLPGWCSVE